MSYRKLLTATKSGTRLEQLKILASELAESIDQAYKNADNIRYVAPLAKQYRETISEIEQIEGNSDTDDEIGNILQEREIDGKPGAVRKDRTGL